MKTILLATHNQGKIKRYRALFKGINNLELVTLADLKIDVKVDEPFHTPEENSVYKAIEYGKLSLLPTIAIDEAVSTNFLPDHAQPGVFVRRLSKGHELSDLEMLAKWQEIFLLYPADDRQFIWDFRLSYYNPENNDLRTVKAVQKNTVADKFSSIINPGYPMSSFLIPEGLDRPHSDLSEAEALAVDSQRLKPFFDFMEQIVNE